MKRLLLLLLAVVLVLVVLPAAAGAASSLQNAGLETDANSDGVPDCWMKGGYGTNTYSFTRTTDAHSGSWAEKVAITSYSSGDRKLVVNQDAGTCGIAVTPGKPYRLSAYFKTTGAANPQIAVYLRTTGGSWSYWASSGHAGSSSSWNQVTWSTPSIPSGYAYLSFGLYFQSTGTLTTDDYSFVDPSAADTTAPDTTITAHPPNPSNSSTGTFSFTGTDNVGVDHFECSLDFGAWTTCSSPKTYTGLTEGDHGFGVRAVDAAGNFDASWATWAWTIDQTAPDTVIDAAPADGTSTSASVSFHSTETGSTFECRLDGGSWSSCTSPKSYSSLAVGQHTVDVRATDAAGNTDATPATASWTISSGATNILYQDNFDAPTGSIGGSGCTGDLWGTLPWASPPCQPPDWYVEGPYHVVSDPNTASGKALEEDPSKYDCTSGCTANVWLHNPLPGASQRVDMRVRLIKPGANYNNICSWAGGPKLFMGRQADVYETSTYTIEDDICDGSAHIQKKAWGVNDCGSDPEAVDCGAGGTWYLLANTHPGALPFDGAWHTFSGVKTDNADGSVTLAGYRDGQLVVGPVTEHPGDHSLGPLRGGRVGWRSNAVDWHADSFTVTANP